MSRKKEAAFRELRHLGSEAVLLDDRAPNTQGRGAASQKDGQFGFFDKQNCTNQTYIQHKSNFVFLHAPSFLPIIFPLPVFSFLLLLLFLFS